MRMPLLFVAALLVAGCPPSAAKKGSACTHVGESCEVAPGKLGTCVVRDGCNAAAEACFTCQSQH